MISVFISFHDAVGWPSRAHVILLAVFFSQLSGLPVEDSHLLMNSGIIIFTRSYVRPLPEFVLHHFSFVIGRNPASGMTPVLITNLTPSGVDVVLEQTNSGLIDQTLCIAIDEI
jgi:hypothetical protein